MLSSRPDVLLVEDDAAIREALSELLQDEGFAVQTAIHGQAAVDALDAGTRPRMILLDLMMPVMDGWQFLDHIKERSECAAIPIIVVSAAKEPLPSGASSCLSKPLDLAALFDTLGTYCGPVDARDLPVALTGSIKPQALLA